MATKLFGDNTDVLNGTADKIADVLRKVPCASEVTVEQMTRLPMLTVQINGEQAAPYGLIVGYIQETVSTAIGGKEAYTLFQGDRRFDIVVRLAETFRHYMEAMKRLPIPLPSGKDGRTNYIPLGEAAKLDVAPCTNQISREMASVAS